MALGESGERPRLWPIVRVELRGCFPTSLFPNAAAALRRYVGWTRDTDERVPSGATIPARIYLLSGQGHVADAIPTKARHRTERRSSRTTRRVPRRVVDEPAKSVCFARSA